MRLIIALVFLSTLLPAQGVYRWDVKIAVDTAGQRIFKTKPIPETISNLTSKKTNKRPDAPEMQKGLRAQKEKRKVTVTAYVIGLGKEPDGDYHIILKALRSKKTLVAEIPKPDQPKLAGFPTYKKLYGKARDNVDNDIQVPTTKIKDIEPIKVIITGFVFYDINNTDGHGKGSAKENAIKIHPILTPKVVK